MSNLILSCLMAADNTGVRAEKTSEILEVLSAPYGHQVVVYASSAFRRFHIRETRGLINTSGTRELDEDFFKILDNLQTRLYLKTTALMLLEKYTDDVQEIFHRIIDKSLVEGMGLKTINEAIRQYNVQNVNDLPFVPDFSVQLAEPFDEKFLINAYGEYRDYYLSPKIDGMRIIGIVENREVSFYSRNGLLVNSLEHLKPQILSLSPEANFVVDGEGTNGDFNSTMSALRKKKGQATEAVYHIFDIIPHEEFMLGFMTPDSMKLRDRLERLAVLNWGSDTPNLRLLPHDFNCDIKVVNDKWVKLRLEGSVIKLADAGYDFRRSVSWMKIKGYDEADCEITGFELGKGKYSATLGKLVVDFKGVEVRVSGMSDKMRDEFWNNSQEYLGCTVEVGYHEVTPDGSLRHPRFIRLRPDKD